MYNVIFCLCYSVQLSLSYLSDSTKLWGYTGKYLSVINYTWWLVQVFFALCCIQCRYCRHIYTTCVPTRSTHRLHCRHPPSTNPSQHRTVTLSHTRHASPPFLPSRAMSKRGSRWRPTVSTSGSTEAVVRPTSSGCSTDCSGCETTAQTQTDSTTPRTPITITPTKKKTDESGCC